jgi:hypothetical protein
LEAGASSVVMPPADLRAAACASSPAITIVMPHACKMCIRHVAFLSWQGAHEFVVAISYSIISEIAARQWRANETQLQSGTSYYISSRLNAPFCYIWRVAYISSRQAGLVCLPPLDAVLPRSLCRVTGLDNPSPDYDYVTASIVNDLYHTVLQIRNAYREVNCNERKNTEAFRPKQRQSKFVTHTMKMETKYYEAGIQERLYTHQNHIMGPKIIQLSSTQLHHIFF